MMATWSVRKGFWEHPAEIGERYFGEGGRTVDVLMMFRPDRKTMSVHIPFSPLILFSPSLSWNTQVSARKSNYGTHVDYIIVTPGLLPWIEAGDIAPVNGSDHCPIWVGLREEIEVDVGGEGGRRAKKIVKSRDVMRVRGE